MAARLLSSRARSRLSCRVHVRSGYGNDCFLEPLFPCLAGKSHDTLHLSCVGSLLLDVGRRKATLRLVCRLWSQFKTV
jgi:hypothetical protein